MTQAPNPNSQPDPESNADSSSSSSSHKRRLKSLIIVGGVAVAGIIAGVGAAQYFIYRRLAPLVETNLSTLLNRPVELGDVKGFTLSGLMIDGAAVPPTADSQDYARVETVQVGFNLPNVVSSLVRDRTLPLTIRLISPEVYGYEDADGQWLRLDIQQPDGDSDFSVALNQVRVDNATVILMAYPPALESPWENETFFDDLQALEEAIALSGAEQVEAAAANQIPGNDLSRFDSDAVSNRLGDPQLSSPQLPVVLEDIDATATLRDSNRFVEFDVAATARQGGTVRLRGDADLKLMRFHTVVQARELTAAQFSPLLPLPGEILAGTINSYLEIAYRSNQSPAFRGTARVRDMTVEVDAAPLAIADINSRLRFDGQTVMVEDTRLSYGDANITATGSVNLETGYDLTAQLQPMTLAEVQSTVNLDLPFETVGRLAADVAIGGVLSRPVIEGTLNSVEALQIDQVEVETLLAEFRLTPPILNVNRLTIIPADGGQIIGTGNVNLEADGGVLFSAQLLDLPGDALAANYGVTLPDEYEIGTVDAEVEVFGPYTGIQAIANWQLRNNAYPGQGEVRYDGNQIRLQNTQFNLADEAGGGGTATVDATLDLDQGVWEAALEAFDINLQPFTDQVQGQLSSTLQLSGSLDNLSPEAIALEGQARLANAQVTVIPDAEALIQPGDWTTTFVWTGQGLQIERFMAPGIEASGFVAANLDGTPTLGPIDLAVVLRQLQLAPLTTFLPEAVQSQAQLQGTADFRGQVTGDLINPQIAGNLRLNQLAVNTFDFNPVLQGDVRFSLAAGGAVDLRGGGDRLAVQLDDRFVPVSFAVQQQADEEGIQPFTAEGRTVGDRLVAEIRNFRLNELAFNPLPQENIGFLGGVVNANLDAQLSDLSNPAVAGSVAIARLGIGYLVVDRFTGDFTYRNGRVALNDVDVNVGDSTIQLAAQADVLDPRLTYQASLIADTQLQDIVDFLDLISIDDLQRSFDAPLYQGEDLLMTEAAGRPNASLLDQLTYMREFVARRAQEETQTDIALLPPLTELEGELDSQIRVQGSLAAGPTADFQIEGQNWVWGPYDEPNQLTVNGSFTNETLTLEPFEFISDTAQVRLRGQLGNTQQDAILNVRNVPLDLVQSFVALPLDLAGDLQVNAAIGGVLTNPTVTGDIDIVEPVLNGTPLELAGVDFNYQNARLALDGAAVIEQPERLTVRGSVPYALPFMTVQPESDRLDLDIDLRNEGLAFLNLVSQGQAMWEGGMGDIDLKITGTLEQPQFLGTATFQDGMIASPLLNNPITGITGSANFNLDSVTVNTLNAQLQDGTINIQGAVPIFKEASVPENSNPPLRVTLNDLPLNFEGFLVADVNGEIIVRRAVLAPEISGQVSAANGRIITRRLPTRDEAEATSNNTAAAAESMDDSDFGESALAIDTATDANGTLANFGSTPEELPGFLNQVQFNDFKLVLANDLDIIGSPVFNISAVGDLVINGTAADIRPDGVIRLTDGWINLFATQFRLDRDAPNTATFIPSQGLDPELDVQMVATVREIERTPIPPSSPFATAEVIDQSAIPTFGGLQTVEIFATVQGPASSLAQSLDTALDTASDSTPPAQVGEEVLVLSSEPSRSESQIIGLIGGQAIANFEQGGAIASVATFVGSGFLSNVGSNIADALGLSTFSIFPTTGDLGGESRLPLAIGLEAGFDITRDLSFSVLEILDGNLDPQFGLQYEIDNNFRVRASTNLNDDTRAILEYRSRF